MQRPSRPASAGGGLSRGQRSGAIGGLVSRTWELALEQQSGGNKTRQHCGMLALDKSALADTHSLLDSFVQERTSVAASSTPSGSASAAVGGASQGYSMSSLAPGGAGTSGGGGRLMDESLASRSAFTLDVSASSQRIGGSAERARRRQCRSRQQYRRPASAGSLRAAHSSWGAVQARGNGLAQLTNPQKQRSGAGRKSAAWAFEDNLASLQRQSGRFSGAVITLG